MRRQKRRDRINELVFEYVDNNSKKYIVLIIMLLIGVSFSILFVNNSNGTEQEDMSLYINNYIENIKNSNDIPKQTLLLEYIKFDTIIALTLWFLGLTVLGNPLIHMGIMLKGYSIGCTISVVIATLGLGKGGLLMLSTMLLKYIIYIPIIISLGVSSLNSYSSIYKERKWDTIKSQIVKHTMFCGMMYIIILISSVVATYSCGILLNLIAKWY